MFLSLKFVLIQANSADPDDFAAFHLVRVPIQRFPVYKGLINILTIYLIETLPVLQIASVQAKWWVYFPQIQIELKISMYRLRVCFCLYHTFFPVACKAVGHFHLCVSNA